MSINGAGYKEAYEKEMQKQEAAQTSKKKKRTVKKPAKPLLDGLLGKKAAMRQT